jgi:hypothetical protein
MASDKQFGAKLVISAIGVAAIALNKWYPDFFKLDPISAAFLVVAILPWFNGVIKAVKFPFLEIELQEAKEKAERALEVAEDAKGAAAGAETRTRIAESLAGHGVTGLQVPPGSEAASLPSAPADLVKEYNRIRETYKSGALRTDLMEQIVAKMVKAAKEDEGFEVDRRLNDSDKGWRLFAYAFLIARPDFDRFPLLVKSSFGFIGLEADKNQPFGEYWSIRAMQAVAATRGTREVDEKTRRILVTHYQQIRPGTDRHYEMKRLLNMLGIQASL